MTENEFVGKWLLRFRDNDLFEIDEGDLREFTQDIATTFGQDDPRAVFEHIFENQFGKHPDFNTQHEVNAFVLQLLTAKQVQAAPEAPEFSLFDDAANTVVLSHKNYSYLDLRYDLPGGAVGLPVPADGIIKPGNIAGQVAGYVRAAGGRLQSEKTYSPVFTSVTATPQVKPTAPKLTNFDDVANTVNVYHPNYSYVDLRYNFNGQTGLLVSADGLISVGNVAGQVEAYVVADAAQNRVQGLPAFSQPFTTGSVVVPPPVSTTPTVTGFGPTSAVVGAAVTITGTNFTGATAVLFNGTAAAFTVLNATSINATVPAGATSGPVSVATAAGTGTSAASFTVHVVTTPVALTASLLLPNGNTLTAGQNLSFTAGASGGVAPYSHEVSATHTGTGVVSGIGASVGAQYNGIWQNVPAGEYDLINTVTDAAGTVKYSAVRRVTVTAVLVPLTAIDAHVIGDSLIVSTRGGAAGADRLEDIMRRRVTGTSISVTCHGWSGQNAEWIRLNQVSTIAATIDRSGGKLAVAILNLAANDCIWFGSAAAAKNEAALLTAALYAAGFDLVYVVEPMNRADRFADQHLVDTGRTFNTERLALRALERTNSPKYHDGTIALDATVLAAENSVTNAYYFAVNDLDGLSKVHLTAAGNYWYAEAMVQFLAAKVNITLPAVTLPVPPPPNAGYLPTPQPLTYDGLTANEAVVDSRVTKIGGGTAWNAGARSIYKIEMLGPDEVAEVEWDEPRAGHAAALFGVSFSAFDRNNINAIDHAFYYDQNDFGIWENGNWRKSPAARIAGKPKMRITTSSWQYAIGSTVFPVVAGPVGFPLIIVGALGSVEPVGFPSEIPNGIVDAPRLRLVTT